MEKLGKPTVEEYEKAIQERNSLQRWLGLEYERRDSFLDELLNLRENIRTYEEALEKANNVIRKYEIYQEIERETSGE